MNKPAHGLAGKGVVALHAAGRISGVEVVAAERWYLDYTLGVHGVWDADPTHKCGGGDAHTAGFARAQASIAYAGAKSAVGCAGDLLLRLFVADGLSLLALADALEMDRKAIVGAIVMTLRRLAEHHAASAPRGKATGGIISAEFST